MKKIMSFLLTIVVAAALVACGGAGSASTESAMSSLPADASIGQKVIADFTDKANSGIYLTTESLGNAIMEGDYFDIQGAGMPVEPGYLNGFTEEITGFTEGYMFGPAIGSIPFVGYVFVVDEATNVDEFVENLKSKADLRWNICTEADEMQAGSVGNRVCFVMAPTSFEE